MIEPPIPDPQTAAAGRDVEALAACLGLRGLRYRSFRNRPQPRLRVIDAVEQPRATVPRKRPEPLPEQDLLAAVAAAAFPRQALPAGRAAAQHFPLLASVAVAARSAPSRRGPFPMLAAVEGQLGRRRSPTAE